MRTIKFRGERLDGGGWAYGSLWGGANHSFVTPANLGIGFSGSTHFIGAYAYEVTPESVGQWTGLVDRHGKEIFEGDVITNGVFKRVVEFTDGGYYPFTSTVGAFYPDECEVIRSIHDNPELMEV